MDPLTLADNPIAFEIKFPPWQIPSLCVWAGAKSQKNHKLNFLFPPPPTILWIATEEREK